MRNVSLEEHTRIAKDIATLAQERVDEEIKTYNLGLLLRLLGRKMLLDAIALLRQAQLGGIPVDNDLSLGDLAPPPDGGQPPAGNRPRSVLPRSSLHPWGLHLSGRRRMRRPEGIRPGRQSPRAAASTASTWPGTLTLRQTARTTPSLSIRKVERSMPM